MNHEVLWPISVTNPVTKETMNFLGQGKTVIEALDDGKKVLQEPFRPDSSGNAKPSIGIGVVGNIHVVTPDGRNVMKKLKEFETETPTPAP